MKPTREEVIRVARKAGAFLELSTTPEKDMAFLLRFAERFYEAGAAAAREPLVDSSDALWEALGRWCAELTNNDITKIVPPKYLIDAVRIATSRPAAKATGEKA